MRRTGDEMDASRSQHEPHGGRNLSMNEASLFLREVKDTFHDQSDKYVAFLNVLNAWGASRIDYSFALARVKDLFRGHDNLINGFNSFLPYGFEILNYDDEEEDTASSITGE